MIMPQRFADIINMVCETYNKTNLCPFLYKKIEDALKIYVDGRFTLYVLAGTNDTAIVKYHHIKYYIAYNHTTKKYEVEYFRL